MTILLPCDVTDYSFNVTLAGMNNSGKLFWNAQSRVIPLINRPTSTDALNSTMMSQLWLLALVVWLTSASAMDKNKRAIGLDQDETVADRWTASPFGCECYFDASRHDCACCIAGACQCPGDNKNKCVQCGYGSLCDQDQPVIEGVISDGWTGPNECACPEDPFDRSCACCTNGGCLCPHNHDKCTQCGNKCGCSDGCDDGLCGAVPSGSPISLDSDEGLPRDGLGMLNERDPLPGSVPLGVESGLIRDSQMTASSTVDSILGPHRGRLGLYPSYYGLGAWSALISDNHQYLQIDLLYLTLVTGVATQGRSGTINAEYVTSYYIYYSEDGMNWLAFGDAEPLLMKGNSNPDDVVRHNLESGFHARYIRIAPQSYFGRVSLRVEVYGIPPEIPDEEIYGLANLALVKPAQLSSTLHTQFHARIAVDGVEDDGAAISKQQAQPWWYVDLLDHHHVFYITIVNVAAGVFNGLNSLENIVIRVGDDPDIHNNPVCGEFEDMISLGEMVQVECLDHNGIPMSGEYVSVELKAEYPVHLALAEVLVFGVPIPLPGFSGLPDGSHYLGLESGLIDNSQMTSSSHDPAYPAFHGRLNLFQNAWMPSRDDPVPFIQIDLLHLHMLTAIVTQGVAIPKEYWVTQYQLQLSLDGHDFVPYMDANENVMDFEGNHDGHDIMPHVFNSPFEARVVRVIPKTWVRRPAMRIELIGYKINNEPIVPEPNGGGTGTGTCEPIDYELCSALLPYDYGHLPNLLGVQGGSQFESAILEHILHVIVSDCLEPEFLTLFICGLMYPGCDGSADVMLPCRQFCELVSSECAEELGSVVDHSFCENMPDVNSDGECLMEDDIHMSPENKLLMDSWLQRMLGDEPPAGTVSHESPIVIYADEVDIL
ncbi:uncharacterized protein LOC102809369 [Saccoglossus kowalevskii]|uniref:Uncharacterized protein LOC102809369 n=1 Tax=Saccoglossus kowalevskii TaxID=10224 RepID=A0ABM0N0U0_SACKO|nr:PREDICTED: uncharacterized protein LOC102809369 [Saccoglossus kowalevskii]